MFAEHWRKMFKHRKSKHDKMIITDSQVTGVALKYLRIGSHSVTTKTN